MLSEYMFNDLNTIAEMNNIDTEVLIALILDYDYDHSLISNLSISEIEAVRGAYSYSDDVHSFDTDQDYY